jgi:hypothetical protein
MSNPKFPFIILVKYATRGRVERFFEGMETIYNLASQVDYIRVLITADEDDLTMNNDDVKERISKYKNAHVIYGKSNNKIHAINRDFDIMPESHKDWNILANFSDDMRWNIPMWDDYIRVHFNSVFPETLDGYMAYLDVDTQSALSTLYIAGRPFYERFGFIYDPQFVSLFCDNLIEDCAKHIGKYHYTGFTIYKHLNPCYGHIEEDTMFRQQQDIGWDVDNKLYYKIKDEIGIYNYLKQFNL